LPTVAEFQSLYATLGQVSSSDLHMNAAPLSGVSYSWYWTAEPSATGSHQQKVYTPFNNSVTIEADTCCATCSPHTWAVASVPEPQTYAILLAGLGLLGAIAKRRKYKPYPSSKRTMSFGSFGSRSCFAQARRLASQNQTNCCRAE
jgi:hypothetical protein